MDLDFVTQYTGTMAVKNIYLHEDDKARARKVFDTYIIDGIVEACPAEDPPTEDWIVAK